MPTAAHTAMSMEGMEGMAMGSTSTAMPATFYASTRTPLYSTSWTPSSAGAYAGTCIFLIILAIVFRALFTLKAWLDAKALESSLRRRYVVVADQPSIADKAASDADSLTGILTTNGVQENVRVVQAPVKHIQPFRFSVDIPRAALMTVIVGIGYLL